MTEVLQVHSTTLPHLDIIETAILEELLRTGKAIIIDDGRQAPAGVEHVTTRMDS
jgi:hypothetical protein